MLYVRLVLIAAVAAPFLAGLGFWHYSHVAFRARVSPEVPAANLSPDRPVAVLVPLNGTPATLDHPSSRNAVAALETLMRIPDRDRYLILSEGYTGDPCVSGAEITLRLLGLQRGYNAAEDVTVLLEEEATTTFENIAFSTPILEKQFAYTGVSVLISGMSSPYGAPLPERLRVDIGHGARAYMLARSAWHAHPSIEPVGFLPANETDPAIGNYSPWYNLATMFLASAGVMSLPRFDRDGLRGDGVVCAGIYHR